MPEQVGRRVPDEIPPWKLEAGDYNVRRDAQTGERVAWVKLPDGAGPARLKGWDLEEHEDGTISVTPSIQDVGHENGWHGWLTRGIWKW